MNSKPTVAVVVLNYNNYEDTSECLKSLSQLDYPNYQVIVVDNASTDESFNQLKSDFSDETFLQTGENRGYAGGNNYAINYALDNGFEYILVMNNDTIVDSDSLSALVEPMEENDNIGIVGPKLLYYDTNCIQSYGADLTVAQAKPNPFGHRKVDDGRYDSPRTVDHINGAAMMFRSNMLEEIGTFDEKFGFYTEDVDLCVRAREAGYELLVTPKAKIWHKVGSTMTDISGRSTYYRIRSKFIFTRKHASFQQSLIFWMYIPFHIMYTYVLAHLVAQRSLPKVRYILLGVLHGVTGVTGVRSFD